MDSLLQMDSLIQMDSVEQLSVSLIIGALFSYYLKFLYSKFSSSYSNSSVISETFPLLTITTICVIAVIKSSLALSLGLVGALSIVRFRAAIKDPEELIWLFLCIGVGLTLGAGKVEYAGVLLVVVTIVYVPKYYFKNKRKIKNNLLLTITGDADTHFSDPTKGVLKAINELSNLFVIQRYDIDNKQGQIRVIVTKTGVNETMEMMASLKTKLPGCNIAYINMDNML